jgi:hypothetical protein
MFQINLPSFNANIKQQGGRPYIFDMLRRRYVALTPEEWVRQHFIHFLIAYKGYPAPLLANEVSLTVGTEWRRCDSVLYDKALQPRVVMEYKAPTVTVTQKVFEQISAYNSVLHVPYLMVSNGLTHFCCKIDYDRHESIFLKDIPAYDAL